MKKQVLAACLAAVFFSACVSTQRDVTIDRHHEQMDSDLAQVEQLIVPLEAAWAERRPQSDLAAARRMISNLENDTHADAYFSARLSAWSGRLAILEGRYSEAVRLHRQSQAAAAGNVPAIILGIRLEGDPALRLAAVENELIIAVQPSSPGFGELHIEKGRALLELNRFAEAAGAFDAAFAAEINSIYRESYLSFRSRAWEMRNIGDAATATIDVLVQDRISWNDCITMARNETQLLHFISGGRNLSNADFFNRLIERGFIPSTQDVHIMDWPAAPPGRDEIVTRAGAAWFIWHLYAEARADRSLLFRYSARFATGPNPRSPIADIPALSRFFDSILGCVETEFLHLIDGRNFSPAQFIRGTDLLAILRRIDS